MGVKKGTNNFKSFQQKRIQAKLDAIEEFINYLPKRMKFDRFEDLLAECAEHIGCSRTTITRQESYIAKLNDEFQKRNSYLSSDSAKHFSTNQLERLIEAKDAEIVSLKGNLKRTSADLKDANAKITYYKSDDYKQSGFVCNQPEVSDQIAEKKQKNNFKKEFEYTAHAFNLLLQYLEEQRFGIGLRNENDSSKVILADDGLGGIPKKISDSKYLTYFLKYLNKLGAKYGSK
ncbi:hypothetical protein MHM87_05685 [Alteromonas sp. Cnat3-28]|uniref:hypothetical protein n=1 Tax=Alteromonas sp. Cnat3-28 TaxID=2917729 RepID=UPI001EF3DB5A|nr:hypothetical protein [Alteromonas sp. Cnat3-28]MCG7645080.1 hypothetical protein [Alteromonas sp. Cnat3-28]